MGTINGKYTASAEASSRHPQDWGRAMARAMEDLVDQAAVGAGETKHEELYGKNLHLVISESEEGVKITLSWTPESG